MSLALYAENTPQHFWKVIQSVPDAVWLEAIQSSLQDLGYPVENLEQFLLWSLGEGFYNKNKWQLPLIKQVYYVLKPIIPQSVSKRMRRFLSRSDHENLVKHPFWPIDSRYVDFQFLVVSRLMGLLGSDTVEFLHFWPHRHRSAFVLTHDIETDIGQQFCVRLAEVEQSLGFRSTFYFVLDRYPLDWGVIRTLRQMGFAIGVHGVKHDGKLFFNDRILNKRMEIINNGARELESTTFRCPCTLRDPNKLQLLDVESELSFFDTDPYEPMPGGVMTIWPFQMGHLMELPYTLPQDYTLFEVLRQSNTDIWEQKLDWIKAHYGMALFDSHPDYLLSMKNLTMYHQFLDRVKNENDDLWLAQTHEVATWWKQRAEADTADPSIGLHTASVIMDADGQIQIDRLGGREL